jgi:hypothetical protein
MKELFKGLFWPSILMLLGWATYYPLSLFRQDGYVLGDALKFGVILCIGGSIGLILRFWGRSRVRAYGVLAGFIAAPLAAYGLFLLFLATLGRNVHW